MSRRDGVPVYIVTGFLDSGKTRFINEMLADPGFSEGERTLIIRCEEGEDEYDPKLLKQANAVVRDLEEAVTYLSLSGWKNHISSYFPSGRL